MIHERRAAAGLATSSQLRLHGLAELARKVESERLAIYRKQIGVDGPRALDGKSYSELSLGVI